MVKMLKQFNIHSCSNVLVFLYSARAIFVANGFVCQVPADRFLEQTTNRLTELLLIFNFHRSISHARNDYGNKERT